MRKMGFYEKYVKRPQDFCCALAALIVLSPVLAVTAYLVKKKLGSPVIFRQKRPGLNGKIFEMWKFRTMTDARDEVGNLLPDEVRLTDFGKKLRSTSLDELPELVNILKGDMAVVGPRPQLVKDMVFFDKKIFMRQFVRPGLTGLAQVSGRNAISWNEKFNYDLKYISDITFFNDFKIIVNTIKKVVYKNDIVTEGFATSEDYGDWLLRLNKISLSDYKDKISKAKQMCVN